MQKGRKGAGREEMSGMIEDQLREWMALEATLPKWNARQIHNGLPETVTWENGTTHTFEPEYFKHVEGEEVFCAAYTVDGLDTLGNHECGAMEKDAADFVATARNLLRPVIEELLRLRKAVEDAPHPGSCDVWEWQHARIRTKECPPCNCWKSALAATEGKC